MAHASAVVAGGLQDAVGFSPSPAGLRLPSRSTSASSHASSAAERWADAEDGSIAQRPLPRLLGSAGPCKTSSVPAFKIKNTFIDDLVADEDEEDGALPAMGKSWTWSGCGSSSEDEVDKDSLLPGNRRIMAMAPLRPAAVKIEPLESRRPEESAGSGGHGSGACRPCAWFWRPQGCTNGAECFHCHMCGVGEVKKRRRNNKRASIRAAKVAGAASSQ